MPQTCKIEILYVGMRVSLVDFSAPSGSRWRLILEKMICCEFLRFASSSAHRLLKFIHNLKHVSTAVLLCRVARIGVHR